jgi:hypothetical protein
MHILTGTLTSARSIRMSVPDPMFPVGSRIRFEDNVAAGDFVYFDGSAEPDLVLVKRLHEWEARNHDGPIYRLEPGDGPTHIKIRRIQFGPRDTGAM